MKKRILTYLGMVFLTCLSGVSVFAQVNMPLNPATPVANVVVGAAAINFFDNGGAAGNYANNSGANSTITFVPQTAGNRIRVNFTSFATEGNFDALYIDNGGSLTTADLCPAPRVATGTCNSAVALTYGPTVNFPDDGFTGTLLQGRSVFSTSGDGALKFTFRSDASVVLAGWSATVTSEANPCRLIPPANASAPVGANCGPNTVSLTVPTYTNAACVAGATLQYRVDCGPAIVVGVLPVAGPVVTGLLNPGVHSIQWEVLQGACLLTDGTSYATVLDVVPPTIVCPANITANLDAGECGQVVSYNLPTVADNCPWTAPATPAQIPASFIAHGSGVVTYGGNAVQGGYYFSVTNTSTQARDLNGLGIRFGDPAFGAYAAPQTVQIYARTGGFAGFEGSATGWTNLGPQVANPIPAYFANGTGALAQVSFSAPQAIAPGATVSFHVFGNSACPIANWNGGVQPSSANGGFTVTGGAWASGLFTVGVAGGTTIPNIQLNYSAAAVAPLPTQTSGLPSGSVFPLGTTTNCFSITDFAGNMASCCFDVNVLEYPNVTQQLACNDNIQISLDQTCDAVIGADDILEGGLYGCYDTRYTTMIITPMGGTVSPAVVDACYIGNGPHTVKVVDNVTGQSCWGSVIVEDKLAPVMICRDLRVACTDDISANGDFYLPGPAITGPQSIIRENLNTPLGEVGAPVPDVHDFTFDFNYIPAGVPVLDADVRVKLTGHNSLPEVDIQLISPAGVVTDVFTLTGCTGQDWPIDVIFDDEGTGNLTLCVQLDAAGARLQPVVFPGASGLALFNQDGGDAHGIWTLRFRDTGNSANDGLIETAGVILTVDAPAVFPSDNCDIATNIPSQCYHDVTLTSVDNFTDGACGGPAGSVVRTWTATDFYGNHTTCVQRITIERPTLNDVDAPQDIQWTCEQYNAFPNVVDPTALHPFITDTDLGTAIIDVTLDPNCDDLDATGTDNPAVNNTNTVNGGLGCPGSLPNNIGGLDDADVLALTGSGIPTVNGLPLKNICEITYEWSDIEVNVCPGTFKIIRRWTLIDWCSNPADIRHIDQLIKVVDDKAPVLELLAVAGQTTSNYGTHDIPALGNGGGCNQEPQLSGGTQFLAHVQLPAGLTPQQFTNVRLEKLWLEVDHARLSDLDIFLRSPAGRVLQITANNGGTGTSIDADFFDAATGNVNEAQFNVIGDFKPEGHNAVQYSYSNVFGQGFSPNYTAAWTVTFNGLTQTFNTTLTQANAMSQLANFMNANDPAAGQSPYTPNWTNTAGIFSINGGYGGNGVSYGNLIITHVTTGQVTIIQPTVQGVSCGGFTSNINSFAAFDDPNLGFTADMLGNWELIVFDEVANATGKVVNWKLFFSTGTLTIDVYNASTPQNSGPHAICEGTVVVPPVDGYDNCSGIAGYTSELWTIVPGSNPALPMTQLASVSGNGGTFNNVPLFANGANARYIVRHYATDGCGNQSFIDRVITLRDKVPPTPVCVEYTEISITNNSNQTGGSCSRLYAEDLDKASYDNCKPVYFLMAKMNDATSTNIFNRCYYPYRDFCCDEIGNQQVILLVLDQDPTPFFSTQPVGATFGCDGTPGLFLSNNFASNTSALNFNTCMVDVQVSDKLHPVLVSCPPNQRITCDWYADNLETQLAGLTTAAQRSALLTTLGFGAPTYYDNCSINLVPGFQMNLDQCLEGTITRQWNQTTDGAGNAALQQCTQTINVDHVSDWAVEFPADVTINCGTNPPSFGEPEIFYETCELVAVTSEDQTFTVVADACYKIVRTWTIINWCVVGAEIDQEVVEQPENALGLSAPQCDIDSDGDCDNRTFRDSWRGSAPVPNPFAPAAYRLRPTANDAHTPNNNPILNFRNPDTDVDTDPWDGYITYQQVIKVQDNIDPVFTNGCTIPDVCIEGTTCGATVLLPEPEITECSDNYTVTVQIQIGGVWLSGYGPYLGVAPGTYPVRYVAADNCNNQTECLSSVTVKDCKKPTPYCKAGIIIEIMQTGMVDVWASDLDAGSFDNCPGTLKLSFSADVNDIGNTYTCDDLGQQEVEIWVTDAAGNQDFCITFVTIQDNMGACTDDPIVAGLIANEDDVTVEGVSVNINGNNSFDQTITTANNGAFSAEVIDGGDYTITPQYDENPLNGVSTFDLVLISKHILGVTLLDSPYKMIAADANKSNSVTTFDLVEIRKLILFINTDFPSNTSWRFVDAAFNFPNANNPFATAFPEVINLNDVTVDMLNNNFVAVKIGDVNGSAAVNLLGAAGERNMVGDLVLNADDATIEAGKEYTVEFKATDFNVSGYQFSLNFNNKALEFVSVAAGVADASNFGTTMVNEGVITASWNSEEAKRLATGEVVFGLTFKALQSGRMSELMNINSSYTVAEAYNSNNELLNVALSFNNNLVSGAFDLYQNTPNPFASVTTIGFYLPEATSATLTISDVQGKVVKVIKGDYSKGYNTVKLNRSDLGAAGVLSYRLDTDSDSATRKMILVD